MTNPEPASSDLDAASDPVADGSYDTSYYDDIASIPEFDTQSVARRSLYTTVHHSPRRVWRRAAAEKGKVVCKDVKASSRTIYVYGTVPEHALQNGHLNLHVNVCFQDGKVIIDKAKNTPFIETHPLVDPSRALIGFQWDFSKAGTSGPLPGITAGCEGEDCSQYRVTYQGQLVQRGKGGGGAGLEIGGGKKGVKLEGNIDVDRPGEDVSVTIVVRATDGATFCAPSQLGFTGKDTCVGPDECYAPSCKHSAPGGGALNP